MQVYKTFFKVMTKYKVSLIMYTAIILFMLAVLTGGGQSNEDEDVSQKKYTILIVDNDQSEVSKAFVEFMGTRQNLKEGTYTDEQVKDMLYYTTIKEYIVIPEGFGEKFMDIVEGGETVEGADGEELAASLLETTYDESMPYAIFINMQIDQYLNAVKNYMAEGVSLKDASQKCTDALDVSKYVSMQKKEVELTEKIYTSFQFLPFGILTIIFSGVLPVVMSFNEAEKKNRTMVSSYKMTKRNIALVAGTFTVAVGVTAILVGLASTAGNYMFTTAWWLAAANAFVYTLSITLLLSMITSLPLGIGKEGSANTTSFCTCIIGLSFAFLGGTFVDITLLGDKVATIGRFIPNYWYSVACRKIWYEGAGLGDVIQSFGMMILFGVVCFSIGLVFTKFYGEKSA